MHEQDGWWAALSPQVRDRIDEALRRQRLIEAIVLLRPEGGLDPVHGLYEAQDMLRERSATPDDESPRWWDSQVA
jgi:hypothetical protein